MSILTVNLKHLYQRRGMWLVYAFLAFAVFGCIVSPIQHPGPGTGRHVGLVMLVSIIGFLATMSSIEVLSKPFSYCLPGHREVIRNLLVSIAIPVCLFASLPFLLNPALHSWLLATAMLAAFGAALVFYWTAVALAFATRNGGVMMGLIPLVFFISIFFELHVLLERAIVLSPAPVALAGILSTAAAWLKLGNPDRARRYCATPWIGFLDALNRNKMRTYANARAAARWKRLKDHPRPWVERFFVSRISRSDYRGSKGYLWGMLYTTFGMMLSQWPSLFWLLLPVVLVAGYLGPKMYFMFFIVFLSLLPFLRSLVYSSMLISGGRRQRFYAMLIATSLMAVLGAAFIVLAAGLSVPLTPVMPAFNVRGLELSFHTIDMLLFCAPLLVLPVCATLHVLFYRKPIAMIVSIFPASYLLLMLAMIWHKELAPLVTPASVLLTVVLAWILFVLVLAHVSAKRCLVGP